MTDLPNPGPGFGPPPPDPAETSNVAGVPSVGDVPTWQAPAGAGGHAAWASGGGGGGAFAVVRVPLAFNTPNLVLTGTPIWTPAAGDLILYGVAILSITTAWNGTTPTLHLGTAASLDVYSTAFSGVVGDLGTPDSAAGAHASTPAGFSTPGPPLLMADAEPVTVMVDDGSGGDPGSTHGAGALIFVVVGV